ncbi:MAG: DHHA1 domain-containing protein [Bacillota bacterium]
MTQRLYYNDSYLVSFHARVVAVDPADEPGLYRVILDRTAFYPESGGQPADGGTIAGHPVTGVTEQDDQVVHLVRLEATIAQSLVGQEVEGAIDWPRRLDHLQQHAGQHLLSAAFEQLYDADTIGFHLGDEEVTIDLTLDELTVEAAKAAERRVNQVVLENRPIRVRWADPEEAAGLPLRKRPERAGTLRLIEVEGFDLNACGGTHPRRTGEVGLVKIIGWERMRRQVRVRFFCGWRALSDYSLKNEIVAGLVATLAVPAVQLRDEAARLQESLAAADRELRQLRQELLAAEAAALLAGASSNPAGLRVLVRRWEGREAGELRLLAQMTLKEATSTIVVFGSVQAEKAHLVLGRSNDLELDVRPALNAALALVEGRGGGPPALAQGGGPATGRLNEALEAARRLLPGEGQE